MGALRECTADAPPACERCGRRPWCAGARMVCGFCGHEWQSTAAEVRIVARGGPVDIGASEASSPRPTAGGSGGDGR